MKFTVNSVAKSGARLGSLSEFSRLPNVILETPYLLLHTRGGSVPHLSHDLLQMVSKEQHLIQTPIVTLLEHIKSITSFGKGVAAFAGLQEYLTYVTVQDSGTATPEGYNMKNAVSVWTRGGRKLIDTTTFVSSMEALKPDVFQMLADSDTTLNSSTKRVKNSVDATIKFAAICAEAKEKSEVLRHIPMFACVTGGFNIKDRIRCINELKQYNVDGYVIDGFHTNGPSATNMNWDDVEPVFLEILTAIPEDKPRVFHGPVTPVVLLKLLSKGIDMVDATFPWIVAERGGALIFPNSVSHPQDGLVESLPVLKDVVITRKEGDEAAATEHESAHRHYEIDLRDKVYFNDSRPLLGGCSCYSCRKYARCYVHHLLTTNELLGPILLMMHNLHHYLDFVRNIRTALKEDQLEALQAHLEQFVSSRTAN